MSFLKKRAIVALFLGVPLLEMALLTPLTAIASTVLLPKPSGPFSVGTKAIEVTDSQRKMFRDEHPRRWMIQTFYPSEQAEAKAYPYMPGTLESGEVLGVTVFSHAQPNRAFSKAGPFPVILFLPGLGNVRQSYTILCEEIASQGYVVLSFDQPYVSNLVRFPDGSRVTLTFSDAWKVPRDRDFRYRYYDEAMDAAIQDFRFVLDHLPQINTDNFSGQLKVKLVATMGHSFGGNVAHTFGFNDDRVSAILDVDSKITERPIHGRIGVPPNIKGKPVLFVRATKQYQDNVGDSLKKIENAEIKLYDVQHSAFHDNAFLVRHIPSMRETNMLTKVWTWFFTTGPQFDPVDTDLGGVEVESWFRQLNRDLVLWLKQRFLSS